jgi:HD domain-containing protein
MNVSQVYKIYQVPESLQKHMLRVASLASILLENWIGKRVDKVDIIRACSLHDIAKPITFDLAKQAEYGMSEDQVERLKHLQSQLKARYGAQEHNATIGICKDVGCNPNTIKFVDNLEWKYIPRWLMAKDIESLIPIYCDMRIGPKGILTLQERLDDMKKRRDVDDYEQNIENGKAVEIEIKKSVDIDINFIVDEQLIQYFGSLLSMEL